MFVHVQKYDSTGFLELLLRGHTYMMYIENDNVSFAAGSCMLVMRGNMHPGGVEGVRHPKGMICKLSRQQGYPNRQN